MANEAQNKLTLRVGVVLDKDATTKEWIRLQKQINDIEESTMRRRKKNSDDVQDSLGKQTSLMGKLNKEVTKTVGNFLKFTVVSTIFMAITQSIRGAFQLSLELNKSWTNFNIVAKASETQLAMVDAQINGLANSLGKLKTEIIDATTEFIRAGYSIEESMIIAENGIMAANAGMVDMEDITKYLIAGLKSFKLEAEDSARVLDVLFSVANITAIDLEGIGEAFLRSANTLKFSGASLEESAALIAAANETIQDPAKVGTALKTIASRLRGVGEEGEVVPTLANDFKQVGVEIQNADGSFRDIYSIFSDFSKVYQNLDDLTKQSLIEKIAGKRQANILVGLLENFELAQTSLETAYNSAGEVARANELVVESLEGKINILKNTVNELSQELLNGEGFKVLIDSLTAIIKLINFLSSGLVGVATGIGLVVAGLYAMKAALTALSMSSILGVVLGIATSVVGLVVSINGATDSMGESVEEISANLAEVNAEIQKIQSQIDGLNAKGIENLTDAEKDRLSILEQVLATKQEIARLDAAKLIDEGIADSNKVLNDAEGLVKEAEQLRDDIQSVQDEISTTTLDTTALEELMKADKDAFVEMYDSMIRSRGEILAEIESLMSTQATVEFNGDEWVKAQTQINVLTQALAGIDARWSALGFTLTNVKTETRELTGQEQLLANQLGHVNSIILDSADKHDLLKSAIEQMTEKGYITQDMIQSLSENGYGNLVSALSEGEEGFISLANVMLSNNRTLIESELEKTKKTIDNIKIRIAGYEEEIRALVNLAEAGGGNTIGAAIYGAQKTGINEAKKNLANLEDAVGLLGNKLLELDDIEKRTSDTRKSSTSSTESSTKALTANERALRDVNQQIALNQKLQSRTDDDQEKIKLNLELIELYKNQIKIYKDMETELKANNKGITSSNEKYDEYIDKLYQLSLNIEDATNGIYSLTEANQQLVNSFLDDKLDKANEKIEELSDKMNDLVDDEIEKLKEKQSVADKSYETEIKAIDDSIDALKEKNELLDEQAQLELKLANLRELIAKRDNILANRNARLVKDSEVGFEWVADPRELRAAGEEIADAEKDIADYRITMRRNAELRALEQLKADKETQRQIEKDNYDKQIQELETFQSHMNETIEIGGKITSETWQGILDTLSSQNANSLAGMLSQLNSFVSQYNATMSTITQTQSQLDNGASPSLLNISNQEKYLQNLLTNGTTGQKAWAKAQLGMVTTTPTATDMSKNLAPAGSVSNSNMNINSLNVNTNANSINGIINDARRKNAIMDTKY